MKIGLMHNLYGQFSRGGAETIVAMMAADFKKAGHEVFLITTKPLNSTTPIIKNNDDNLKIYYLPSLFYDLAKIPVPLRLFWHIGQMFSLKFRNVKKILLTEKPDLVITHNLLGLGFLTPMIIRRLKIRHEHFLHDIQLLHPSGLMLWGEEKKLDTGLTKIYQRLTRALFASPAKVTSPSRWLLERHRERGFFKKSGTEIKLKNPIGLETAATRTRGERRELKNFLFVGQIEKHKGILFLITAFKKIPDQTITLTIAGDGESLAEAKALADGDHRLKFLGRLSGEEVKRYMLKADCLIVPSLCYENAPTVIYEAHGVGLLVMAAALGGISEITDKDDLLFMPGDENDLIKKISLIIKTPG